MTVRSLSACGLAAAIALMAGRPGPALTVPAQAAPEPAQAPVASTLDDQVDLAVTVYNSDLALVRDVRTIRIGSGINDLHFMDIAATVNPASVHFRSLTDPAKVNVLEQNYEYDLLEPDKLLRKYVGRDVTLIRRRTETGTTKDEEVKARLLSYNNGPVWQINGEIVTGLSADHIRFPDLPGNLYSRPTLIWTLDNTGGSSQKVETSYLAGRLQWSADYVLTVTRDDKAADLDGWVTLVNGSGTTFRHAKLQLVAGDLQSRTRRAEQGHGDGSNRARRRRGGSNGAGVLLRLSPVHAEPEDLDQQQRDQAAEHAVRNRLSRPQALRRRRSVVLLPKSPPGRPDEGSRPGVLRAEERGESRTRHAAARGHGSGVSGRLERRRPVRRGGPHRSHQRTRRST